MGTPLNVLLVEDNEDDADLIVLELKRSCFDPSFQRVDSPQALTSALQAQPWDVILCDYALPQLNGEGTLLIIRNTLGPDVPVIFVSGGIGEETAVGLMRAGAQDYVLKSNLAKLPVAIKRELKAAKLLCEKKQTDEKLDEQNRLLHHLMAGIPDAIYFKDLQLRYTALNEAARRMLNAVGDDDVLGKTAESLLSPECARRWREQEERVLAAGEAMVDSEESVIQANGTVCWFSVTKVPLRDHNGKITGLVGIARDITERKLNEQMKNEFISTVSHELRTPLTSIAGALQLIAAGVAGTLPDTAMHLLKIAHKNCERLVRLTNDILDIERIETGAMESDLEPIAVRPLVEEAIEANCGFAEQYGVTVRLEGGNEQGVVLADNDQLIQIITNLLSNAVKFSPRGADVIVTIDGNEAEVCISIRDHGPGIPESFRGRIFGKFVQVDASDSRQKGGTGLGLSIVKQIVDRLGGKVDFVPAPDGGTIFHVLLPRLKRPTIPADTDGKAEARAIA